MTGRNQTIVSEFLLLGLPIESEHQNLFYALFLAMYVTTVLGNLLILVLICLDPHLHTPMYLFLSNLSFSDLCFSSVTMPKLLQNMQSQDPSLSYADCLTQMYFFLFYGDLESFLLVAMAYDRYVAICFPLHYTTIMSPRLYLSLLVLSWVLTICIFVIVYGRMIEVYLVTSIAPIPMATMGNREWSSMGQNYLRSLFALGFQAFLIIVCVAVYAVLVQTIAVDTDVIKAIWTCIGYTVLLCFTLFKTSSLSKSIFGAH